MAAGLRLDLLGELTALSQAPIWIKGRLLRSEGRRGREALKGRKKVRDGRVRKMRREALGRVKGGEEEKARKGQKRREKMETWNGRRGGQESGGGKAICPSISRLIDALVRMSVMLSVCVQDYCKSNQPISFGPPIGRTD